MITLLVFSAPLILAALGELIGQRGGVINIGLEGMMLIGAFVGVLVADRTGSLMLAFGLAAASGTALGLLSGWFTVRLAADQVVVGTALNLMALGVTSLAFRASYGATGKLLNTPAVPKALGLDLGVWFMLAAIPLVGLLVYRTNWGLALRAAGGYPRAAEAAGFSVEKLRLQGVGLGGFFAGIAGAYLSLGVANSFAEGMTVGRGFLAIALVTFGRWRPAFIVLAGLLIGYCQSLKFSLQGTQFHLGFGSFEIPSQLWLALPYVVALVVLVIVGKGTIAPGALGVPYKKER